MNIIYEYMMRFIKKWKYWKIKYQIKFYPKNFLIFCLILLIPVIPVISRVVEFHCLSPEERKMMESEDKNKAMDRQAKEEEKAYNEYYSSLSKEEQKEKDREDREYEKQLTREREEEERTYKEYKNDWSNQPTGYNEKSGWTIENKEINL